MRTILLATDGSDGAAEALTFAIDLCRETGAALQVVSVRPRLVAGPPGFGPAVAEMLEIGVAERVAAEAAATACKAGVRAYAHVAHGEAARAIGVAGLELEANLLIVGSHGLGPFSGSLLGSVSRKLACCSAIPLTIVRARSRELARA